MNKLCKLLLLLISLLGLETRTAQSQERVDITLHELDDVIANKAAYKQEFESKITYIKSRIESSPSNREELYRDLFRSYLHFQADSALHYVNIRAKMADIVGNSALKNEITISRAEVYGVMGMYNETLEELESIETQRLDPSTKGYYYRTYRAYYGWLADYTAVDSAKEKYLNLADKYRDSVLMVEPIAVNRNMIEIERLINNNRLDKAIEELNILSALTEDNKQQAYIHYNLAEAYLKKGNTEAAIFYLAKTAIVDLKMGTREYASLQHLAYALYQQGDIDRAYRYLSCSMDDAVACNARLRFMEVTKYYPIIDHAYRSKDEMQQNTTFKLLLSVSLFAIILILYTIYLFLGRRRLAAMRADLYNTNKSLLKLNNRLTEAGRIKEVYIARYLERCVTYIDKLDIYRRTLKRLATSSKTEELLKALRSEQMLQRERKEFYTEFDASFLTLFPHFVGDFNKLLNEEDRMVLKSERQLNTELRIFALIRLGFTDAAQIAHFLGYSLATVYSYRSKIRSRAIVDKDKFEQLVMEL